MQNVPAVAVPVDPLASYIYIQDETNAWICLDSSLAQYYFPNHGSMILILKCSFLWRKDFMALFMDGVQLPEAQG